VVILYTTRFKLCIFVRISENEPAIFSLYSIKGLQSRRLFTARYELNFLHISR